MKLNIKYPFRIGLASPKLILSWATIGFFNGKKYFREVTSSKLLDIKGSPVTNGLFCEKIFGPLISYQCKCNLFRKASKHKINIYTYEEFSMRLNNSLYCLKCGIELNGSWIRRYRMGIIKLVEPIVHPLYIKTIAELLNISKEDLYSFIYSDYHLNSKKFTQEIKENLEFFGGKFLIHILKNKDINLINDYKQLRESLVYLYKESSKKKIFNKIFNLQRFILNNIKLTWFILEVLPVLPPRLRPFIKLDNEWVYSDLNDHYKKIIIKNNKLAHLKKYNEELKKNNIFTKSSVILYKNQVNYLQISINNLFYNSFKKSNNISIKRKISLSTLLEGKYGVFRQNILGKRVNFSGRSVIVGSPQLTFGTCNVPVKMIFKFFSPLISNYNNVKFNNIYKESDIYNNIKVRSWLQTFCSSSYIYLNRAPSLHRMNIQGFIPRLDESVALKLFPLTCSGFNADFDGDQMGIFIPITKQAKLDIKKRVHTGQHIFSPSSGALLMKASQDMVLGVYLLNTDTYIPFINLMHWFSSFEDVITSYDSGLCDLNSLIQVRYKNFIKSNTIYLPITVGRLIFSFSNNIYN
uniref:DNA-directed RNA polymerase subunit n=1 Tax=Piridium sociabile TaxID=2570542 RepID=A0A5B9XVS5_9ALVE|nr:RNA polymerase b'-subunit [Piridium sociabile]